MQWLSDRGWGKAPGLEVHLNAADAEQAFTPTGDLSRLSTAGRAVLQWLTMVYEGQDPPAPVDALRQLLGENVPVATLLSPPEPD
jgi:hypothetical protein